MPNSSQPDFDWSQAESLLGDDPENVPEDMAAIVLELIESSRERFEELRVQDPETNRAGISSMAHQLRGSLLNFGFIAVGTALLKLEKQPYASADYASLVKEAHAAFVNSIKLLSERYPRLQLS